MKTRMWFFFGIFLTVAIFTIYLIGCNQYPTTELIEETKVTNPYAEVGQIHNNAFAFILERLNKDKANKWQPVTKKDLESKIFDHLSEFDHEMNLNNEKNADLYQIISNKNYSGRLLKSFILDNVTPEQQYYLDKIDNLIYEIPDLEEFRQELSDLDAEVIPKFNEVEAAPILYKSAVAIASKAYWTENFESWVKSVVNENQLHKSMAMLPDDYAARLVEADAYGAATGVLIALVSGQWYAVLGMATTGAAYGTAIEAIVILYEIFSELISGA